MGIWNMLWGLLTSGWALIVSLLFGLGLLGGCIASGSMEGGVASMTFRPAIVWKVNTGLYFYGGEEPMVQVTGARLTGSAETKPDDVTTPEP